MLKNFLAALKLFKERNPKWAMPLLLPHSDNLYALTPKLYRSAQPTAEAFGEYERFGIQTVIQLRPDNDDEPLIAHTALNLKIVPMRTANITDGHIIAALRLIHGEAAPILFHCRHGADRTGIVAAMYRIICEGWPREEAMAEMLHGGYGFHHRKRQNIVSYLQEVDIEKIRVALEESLTAQRL